MFEQSLDQFSSKSFACVFGFFSHFSCSFLPKLQISQNAGGVKNLTVLQDDTLQQSLWVFVVRVAVKLEHKMQPTRAGNDTQSAQVPICAQPQVLKWLSQTFTAGVSVSQVFLQHHFTQTAGFGTMLVH